MHWIVAVMVGQSLILAVVAWVIYHKVQHGIHLAMTPRMAAQDGNSDSDYVSGSLAAVGKAMSDHEETLCHFERSLQDSEEECPGVSSFETMRRANRSVEKAIDRTTAEIVDVCGDLLSDEQARLEAYQEKTSAFDSTLNDADPEAQLTHATCVLLSMVRELREENKVVRDEVAASKDKIIQLLSRASSAEKSARTDPLTGLFNRRAFSEALVQCGQSHVHHGHPFSVIMIDVDHFKHVNDEYGHAAGDAVLSLLARILQDHSRTSDHVFRLGGEEFAVLLPQCDEKAAKIVAERRRKAIETAILRYAEHQLSITVSCGVAQAFSGESQADLLERVDAALYAAKRGGRNRTETASGENKETIQLSRVDTDLSTAQ
jgi:diguanylate cyclase (GGDEF)-like protein